MSEGEEGLGEEEWEEEEEGEFEEGEGEEDDDDDDEMMSSSAGLAALRTALEELEAVEEGLREATSEVGYFPGTRRGGLGLNLVGRWCLCVRV
jgi:hypothetical protein